MIENDFTIIIQGPMHRNILTMSLLHANINTIISTWDDPTWTHPTILEFLEPIQRPNLRIKLNPLPKKEKIDRVYNKQNRYYQFLSSFKGLKLAETKYSIKVRSDEYYSDLTPLMRVLKESDEKLVTNDVYFRRADYLRYHPSDHLFAAKTEKLIRLFELMMYDCQFNKDGLKYAPFNQFDFYIFAEQQLGMKWVEMHERFEQYPYKFPSDLKEVKRLMSKHFDVVSNHMLGDFYITANSERKVFTNNFGYFDPSKDIQTSMDEL